MSFPNDTLPDVLSKAENLPTVPAVAVEILRLCRDEETTLGDLADALARDPALASRLLRFANSSLYNLGGDEVRTLHRATLVLGMKTVQVMALSFSLVSGLRKQGVSPHFDHERFWQRSILRAVVSRALTNRTGCLAQDEAFLCGLLAELGQLTLAECMPEEYGPVLAHTKGWPTADSERELLGFHHGDVAQALLKSWDFPPLIQRVLGAVREDEEALANLASEEVELAHHVWVASAALDFFLAEDGPVLPELVTSASRWLRLEGEALFEFLDTVQPLARETFQSLSVTQPEPDFAELLEQARSELLERGMSTLHQLEATRSAVDPVERQGVLDHDALHDELTGLPNETAFLRLLKGELQARLEGVVSAPLGLLVCAPDGIGELRGEARMEALRFLAGTLARLTRDGDLVTRIDGECFAILVARTSLHELRVLTERLRRGVARATESVGSDSVGETVERVSIAVGGACLGRPAGLGDGKALLAVARRCLERALSSRDNRTRIHGRLLGTS